MRETKEQDLFGMDLADKISMRESGLLVVNHEFKTDIGVNYLGRIDFGRGSIDAGDVEPQELMDFMEHVAAKGLYPRSDYSQTFGGCMDGRGNLITLDGKPVPPRPKVIGGPSLFAWNVASIGDFSILEGVDDPLEQFYVVNRTLKKAGFRLGMHVSCGAAAGAKPVMETYGDNFDGISELIGHDARNLLESDPGIEKDMTRGLEKSIDRLSRSKDFTEKNMHKIVAELDGEESIIHLQVDEDHPNHGHDEMAVLFMRVHNAVAWKNQIIDDTGKKAFWQNTVYGNALVNAIARTDAERNRGIVITDQLPLAGAATLGKNQHVGEITGSLPVNNLAS